MKAFGSSESQGNKNKKRRRCLKAPRGCSPLPCPPPRALPPLCLLLMWGKRERRPQGCCGRHLRPCGALRVLGVALAAPTPFSSLVPRGSFTTGNGKRCIAYQSEQRMTGGPWPRRAATAHGAGIIAPPSIQTWGGRFLQTTRHAGVPRSGKEAVPDMQWACRRKEQPQGHGVAAAAARLHSASCTTPSPPAGRPSYPMRPGLKRLRPITQRQSPRTKKRAASAAAAAAAARCMCTKEGRGHWLAGGIFFPAPPAGRPAAPPGCHGAEAEAAEVLKSLPPAPPLRG